MTISHVQKIGSTSGNGVTSVKVIPTTATTPGNTIIACAVWYPSSGAYPTGAITDTAGNTYTTLYSFAGSSGTGPSILIAAAFRAASVATTPGGITATFSTGPFSVLLTDEWSAAGPTQDGSTLTGSGTGTAAAFGSLTTSNIGDVVLAYIASFGNLTTTSWTSGWTTEFQSAAPTISFGYKIPGSTGSYSGTATLSASEIWQSAMIALEPAGPSVSPVGTPTLAAASASNSMSVTASWGTGQSRVAGDLLVAAVTAYGTTTAVLGAAPSGWTLACATIAGKNTISAHYTKTAAGADSAPTFTATCTGTSGDASLQVVMHEWSDSAGSTPVLYSTGLASGTSGTITAVSDLALPAYGCGAIASAICSNGTTAATTTWTAPAGWNLGADQLTSLCSQMSSYYATTATSGSALSALLTHSRTSTFQAATMVVIAPSGTTAGIMVVQHGAATATTSASITASFGAQTTAGNCLFAACSTPVNDATLSTVKIGTSADNWASQAAQTNGTYTTAAIWADPNCAGGQTAVAVTLSGSDSPALDVFEVAGLATSSPLDKSAVAGVNAAGATWSSGASATTTQASEFVLGTVGGFNNAGPTPTVTGPSGWSNQTTLDAATGLFQLTGYQIVAATGAQTYSGTSSLTSPNNYYGAIVATFKAPSSNVSGSAALSGSGTLSAGGSFPAAVALSGSGTLSATGAASQIAVIQHAAESSFHSDIVTIPLGQATRAGNTLIALISPLAQDSTVTSVTVGASNADNWYAPAGFQQTNITYTVMYIWLDPNCAGGQTEVIVNLSNSLEDAAVDIYEVAGLGTAPIPDAYGANQVNAGGTTWTSNASGTTTAGTEFVVGFMAGFANNGVSPTLAGPASPWINEATNVPTTGLFQLTGYQIPSSTGTFTYSGTGGPASPNDYYGAVVATFIPNSAPAGAAALSGSGSLSVGGVFSASVALAGSGTLSGAISFPYAAALTGLGTLSAAPVFAPAAALSGSGTLLAAEILSAAAALSGSGSLTAGPKFAGAVLLSGSGSLTASALFSAAAALAGAGTLSAAPGFTSAAALSGTGTLLAAETIGWLATMSGTGTLTAGPKFPGAVPLSGSGTLTASPLLIAALTLSGSGTLSAAARFAAAAALAGTGSLTAAGQLSAAVALAGAGTLNAAITISTVAALSGSGTLSAAWTASGQAYVALSGSGTLGIVPGWLAAAALSGSGTLTGTPAFRAALAMSGAGTLAAAARFAGALALSGAGTLSAAAVLAASVTMSGSGLLAASSSFQPAAALSGSGTLSAAPALAAALAMTGLGTLTASAGGSVPGAAALSGSGSLLAAARLAAAVIMSGQGILTAAASETFRSTIALSGQGTLTSSGIVPIPTFAALSGFGVLTAIPTVTAPTADQLWQIYQRKLTAFNAAQNLLQEAAIAGGSAWTGRYYVLAYQAEQAADLAYMAWQQVSGSGLPIQ